MFCQCPSSRLFAACLGYMFCQCPSSRHFCYMPWLHVFSMPIIKTFLLHALVTCFLNAHHQDISATCLGYMFCQCPSSRHFCYMPWLHVFSMPIIKTFLLHALVTCFVNAHHQDISATCLGYMFCQCPSPSFVISLPIMYCTCTWWGGT